MLPVILIVVLTAILLMLVVMTYYLRTVKAKFDEADEAGEDGAEKKKDGMADSQTFVYAAIVLVVCFDARYDLHSGKRNNLGRAFDGMDEYHHPFDAHHIWYCMDRCIFLFCFSGKCIEPHERCTR